MKVTRTVQLKKPSVFIRNIEHVSSSKLSEIVSAFKPERIQFICNTKDTPASMAVAYFASESDALQCLSKMKNNSFDGRKISVYYRSFSDITSNF